MKVSKEHIWRLVIEITPEEALRILDHDWNKEVEPSTPGKALHMGLISVARFEKE